MLCAQCEKCPMPPEYGIPNFCPVSAIEGDPNSPIWIVALNPKTKKDQHDNKDQPNPITWAQTDQTAPHFRRLESVLGPEWHKKLFQQSGIAHTDIVKCGSPGFTQVEKDAVPFCKEFLIQQIKKHKPKLLLVLSSAASRIIEEEAKLKDCTEGTWQFDNNDESCHVLLSGYSSPRQDRYAKLRLKRDFLAACNGLLNLS